MSIHNNIISSRPDLNKLIDARNRALWSELSDKYTIELNIHNGPYTITTRQGSTRIAITDGVYSPASFAHELLHLKMEDMEVSPSGRINASFHYSSIINSQVLDDLSWNIGNALDHHKMRSIFLEMGYPIEEFLSDFENPKFSNVEMDLMVKYYKIKGFDKMLTSNFIGHFFYMKSCPNHQFNYDKYYIQFATLNPSLFDIVNDLWRQWDEFDINRFDSLWYNWYEFVSDFVDELESWISSNHK